MGSILRVVLVGGGIGSFAFVTSLPFLPKGEAFLVAWLVAGAAWFFVEKRIEHREARRPMLPDFVVTLDRVPGTDNFVTDLAERRRRTQNAGVLASMLGWVAGAMVLFGLTFPWAFSMIHARWALLASAAFGFYVMGFAMMFLGQLAGSRRWAREIPGAVAPSLAQCALWSVIGTGAVLLGVLLMLGAFAALGSVAEPRSAFPHPLVGLIACVSGLVVLFRGLRKWRRAVATQRQSAGCLRPQPGIKRRIRRA